MYKPLSPHQQHRARSFTPLRTQAGHRSMVTSQAQTNPILRILIFLPAPDT